MTQDLFEHLYKLQVTISKQEKILNKAKLDMIKQLVIEDVPHRFQDRLLSLLED
jgi:hypothetical protein